MEKIFFSPLAKKKILRHFLSNKNSIEREISSKKLYFSHEDCE